MRHPGIGPGVLDAACQHDERSALSIQFMASAEQRLLADGWTLAAHRNRHILPVTGYRIPARPLSL